MAVARGESMDVKTQDSVLEHVEACLICSQKLVSERMLTRQLAALKEADEQQMRVPDHLESALRMEFYKTIPAVRNKGKGIWERGGLLLLLLRLL